MELLDTLAGAPPLTSAGDNKSRSRGDQPRSVRGLWISRQDDSWLQACGSQEHKAVLERARKFSQSSAPILVLGETGTGTLATAHFALTANRPSSHQVFHVPCSRLAGSAQSSQGEAIPELSSLLHKHADDANVSWLLESVHEIPTPWQASFVDFVDQLLIRSRRSSAIVACTATPALLSAIDRGAFREDLFYRLNVHELRLPPLRNRKEDIGPLVSHFLGEIRSGKAAMELTRDALTSLSEYDWPGNVLELRNVISRISVLSETSVVDREELLRHWQPSSPRERPDLTGLNLEEAETRLILQAITRCAGNKTAAAKELGITTRTLHNKVKKYRAQGFVD